MSAGAPRPTVAWEDLSAWCLNWLGAPPADTVFEAGFLSAVWGLRLADGREVVVKARPAMPRLAGCFAVHRHLWAAGIPCPKPLIGPQPLGDHAATAETLLAVAGTPGGAESLRASAAALARVVSLAPHPDAVPGLAPSPGFLAWDHDEPGVWPTPADGNPDLNASPGPRWLDRVAAAVRERLTAYGQPSVIGHGDWSAQNLGWDGVELLAVHDWDSVICQPEAAIAGLAAAQILGFGTTVEHSAAFLDAYEQARGVPWEAADREAAWAAGLWVRAFDAKDAARYGDPDTVLTQAEARTRLELAGLDVNLV
jgi:hypothetical protein